MDHFAVHYELDLPHQWLANLFLEFDYTAQGSRLSRVQRRGPLGVQKAFYPEGPDCAHIYLLHPPAGIVSGDTLRLQVQVKNQAHALLTTPGANRFYRARKSANPADSQQQQHMLFKVAEQAILENLPQETLIYDGANAVNTVDVHLTSSSVYIGWDITCMGLPDANKPFEQGQLRQLNRVYKDNKLHYHDRITLSHHNQLLGSAIGLNGNTVFGNLLCSAPLLSDKTLAAKLIDDIRDCIDELNAQQQLSVTLLDGLIVCRYLGQQSEQCKQYFAAIWTVMRPICCNKKSVSPRIWLT